MTPASREDAAAFPEPVRPYLTGWDLTAVALGALIGGIGPAIVDVMNGPGCAGLLLAGALALSAGKALTTTRDALREASAGRLGASLERAVDASSAALVVVLVAALERLRWDSYLAGRSRGH